MVLRLLLVPINEMVSFLTEVYKFLFRSQTRYVVQGLLDCIRSSFPRVRLFAPDGLTAPSAKRAAVKRWRNPESAFLAATKMFLPEKSV